MVERVEPPTRRAVAGWLLFDPAAQPYFTLVTTFVYGPFFAAAIAPDPVRGQAWWGYASATAGVIIALLAPVLGAISDAGGRRKAWIAGFSVLMVVGMAALWFAVPGAESAVPIALAGYVVAAVGTEFATVFNNAWMPRLVAEDRLGRLSGTGWAFGYIGGLASLLVALGLLVGSPETGKTLFGLTPLFGLDPAAREGERAIGPFSALWYLVFVLPLFLFTPDTDRRAPLRTAVSVGLAQIAATVRSLRSERNVARFLLANMIYNDGLIALFAFGGIYAATTFGWTTIEIGLFGILLTITGTIGAFLGGRLDDRFGSKRVIVGALVLLILMLLAIVSVDRTHIFFMVPVAGPVPGDGLYAAPGERLYLLLGGIIGAVAGPLQAGSRTLLVRLAPRDRITQFFGLFALSGRLTSFAGALTVGLVTTLSASQRIGFSALLAFFLAGLAVVSGVSPRRAARESSG